jgi:hypothetical protein
MAMLVFFSMAIYMFCFPGIPRCLCGALAWAEYC